MPVYRRPGSAHWWIRISIAGRKTRRSTGTADFEQAQEFEERERERLWRLHKLGDGGSTLWQEAAKRWLSEGDSKKKRDREILQWFKKHLKDEPLTAVDEANVRNLRELALADGMARSTVDRFMNTLKAVLRQCVEWRLLDSVPKIPMYRPRTPEPRWITRSQYQSLRSKLPVHLQFAADAAVTTGLRMRSMLSLTWERIDLKAGRAWIPGEKMKAGRAHGLALSPDAVRTFKALRKLNPHGSHVFQWKGKPIDNCHTEAFRRAVRETGLEPLRWHDLRHTWASWAVQSGVTLPELMQLGGWSSYAMVLRYSHLAQDHLASAAAKVTLREPKRAQSKTHVPRPRRKAV